MSALQEFFRWVAWQPGFRSKIHVPDIEYFNLSDKDISIAKAPRYKSFPTLEQIRKVIHSMPSDTDVQRRNRALIAFTLLTGIRDGALASLRLKHIDLAHDPILVKQEPDQVRTKRSKPILSCLLPIGCEDLKTIVIDWIKELLEVKYYSLEHPLFPRTRIGHDANQSFSAQGLEPECWSTASPIREIFKTAFEAAGLPYFHPHLFRRTIAHAGQKICRTPEEFKAWSQCLGHSSPLTTFSSYGELDPDRQSEVIKGLSLENRDEDKFDTILQLLRSGVKTSSI
jgi:integrase